MKMLLMLLLVATTAHAEQTTYYPPQIQAFVDCMSEANLAVVPNAQQEALYREASQCLEDKVADAMAAAGSAADLRAALKDLYLKSTTKLGSYGSRAAHSQYQEAAMAVKLETKLAGLANEAALKRTP